MSPSRVAELEPTLRCDQAGRRHGWTGPFGFVCSVASVDGVDEKGLGTRNARLLLKRLAVAIGRPVSSEELAAVVWPDGLPKQPADQVSVLGSRRRGCWGPTVLPRLDAGYSLAADWFDLVELERRVAELEERLRSGEKASASAAAHAALTPASGGLLPEEDGDWVERSGYLNRNPMSGDSIPCISG